MLAHRSPRYICRLCRGFSTQSSRLNPVAGQVPSAPQTRSVPIAANKPVTSRRVPLSELLARRLSAKPDDEAGVKSGGPKKEISTSQELREPTPISPQPNDSNESATAKSKTSNSSTQKFHTSIRSSTKPKSSSSHSPKSKIHATHGDKPATTRRTKDLENPEDPMPSAPNRWDRDHRPRRRDQNRDRRIEHVSYQVTHAIQEQVGHPADPASAIPAFPGTAAREILRQVHHLEEGEEMTKVGPRKRGAVYNGVKIRAKDVEMRPIHPKDPRPVPTLEHGLDRVLFNPGVIYLQDPRSLVYNFDPYLENIMPMEEFDYDALMEYITSSRDTTLGDMAREHGANFVGSTSSMTSSLCHFHFLLSAWRPVNISMLSSEFTTAYKSFTAMTRSPAGIFLRYKGNGVYAIDADKMYDTNETVLQWLGRSMEKMLTLPPEQMEKYRKSKSHMLEPHERGQPEGYHYTLSDTILMRSQLDCNDARLPGTGVFDLKTRACLAVRMNVHGYEVGADYEIRHLTGLYNSFEREYYDMIRSAFLKYSLQVRIGNMDGIFVAYHNTKRIFGFQYISLDEMDAAIHGNPEVGKQEFHFSVKLFNETLNRAVQQFPEKSLRLIFETRDTKVPQMYIFAEPYDEAEIDAIQNGEYFQALKFAEARAKAEKEAKAAKALAELEETERLEAEATLVETTAPEQEQAEVATEGEAEVSAEAEGEIVGESVTAESEAAETETPIEAAPAEEISAEALPSESSTEPSTSEPQEVESTESEESTEDVGPDPALEGRPLLGMVLKVQNYINGSQITTPPTLGPTDTWEISYSFERYPEDRARRLYTMSSERRRKAHDEEFREQAQEDGQTDESPADKVNSNKSKAKDWNREFLAHLKDLSERGREWREEFDRMFEGREKIVWRGGEPPSKFGEMMWRGEDDKGSTKD